MAAKKKQHLAKYLFGAALRPQNCVWDSLGFFWAAILYILYIFVNISYTGSIPLRFHPPRD